MTARTNSACTAGQRKVVGVSVAALALSTIASAVSGVSSPQRVTASGSAYATAILNDRPSVYYRLGEASGSTAVDSSGNGQNAQYHAGVTYGVAGAIAGDSDTAVSSAGAVLTQGGGTLPSGNEARTFELWINTTTALGCDHYMASNDDFVLDLQHNGGCGSTIDVLDVGGVRVGFPSAPNDGVWHLIDVTYDGTTVAMYEDGASIGLGTAGPYHTVPSNGLTLGPFPGSYDEFAVYPTALTPAQVARHWTAGASTSPACLAASTTVYRSAVVADHPALYLPMSDLSNAANGRVAYDASGACANGDYSSSATADSGGGPPGATSGATVIPVGPPGVRQNGDRLPAGNAARTYEIWVKGSGSMACDAPLMVNDDFEFWFHHNGGCGGTIDSLLVNRSTYFGLPFLTNDGNWHLIDVTYDGTNVRVYDDGQLSGTSTSGAFTTVPARGFSIAGQYAGDYMDAAVYPLGAVRSAHRRALESGRLEVEQPLPAGNHGVRPEHPRAVASALPAPR